MRMSGATDLCHRSRCDFVIRHAQWETVIPFSVVHRLLHAIFKWHDVLLETT